jgi:hypothetical protein
MSLQKACGLDRAVAESGEAPARLPQSALAQVEAGLG